MKPADALSERSNDPAPGDTDAHPASAGSLWQQLLARENLAEALRRVEQKAGAPGIDGMSTRSCGRGCMTIGHRSAQRLTRVPTGRSPFVG